MKFLKNFLLTLCLVFVLTISFGSSVQAASIFGIKDPPGCESKDPFLPNLVICGRNPISAGSCTEYTKQCSVGDLVETGSRIIIWLITIILLVVPIILSYYGAMIMINQKYDGGVSQLKDLRGRFRNTLIFFILMLGAWVIVRTVVDVFQVDPRINTFLIDENGQTVKVRTFNTQ